MSRVGAALGRLSRFYLRSGSGGVRDRPRTRMLRKPGRWSRTGSPKNYRRCFGRGKSARRLPGALPRDLFEPSLPGEAPLLGDKAWRDYQAGRAADRSPTSGRFEDALERRLLERQWRSLFED